MKKLIILLSMLFCVITIHAQTSLTNTLGSLPCDTPSIRVIFDKCPPVTPIKGQLKNSVQTVKPIQDKQGALRDIIVYNVNYNENKIVQPKPAIDTAAIRQQIIARYSAKQYALVNEPTTMMYHRPPLLSPLEKIIVGLGFEALGAGSIWAANKPIITTTTKLVPYQEEYKWTDWVPVSNTANNALAGNHLTKNCDWRDHKDNCNPPVEQPTTPINNSNSNQNTNSNSNSTVVTTNVDVTVTNPITITINMPQPTITPVTKTGYRTAYKLEEATVRKPRDKTMYYALSILSFTAGVSFQVSAIKDLRMRVTPASVSFVKYF